MSSQDPGPAAPDEDASAAEARSFWATGDYLRISELILAQGERLVEWSGLGPQDRVLDVGAGTGAASLPAAVAGARVTATDLTPELLEIGERLARERGLDLEWRTADASALPFPDASYDVVMSAIGAMFAPDQQATADELVRVCRPGGTIAMANWTPGGGAGRFFGVMAPYVPPAPAGPAPTDWGDPDHVAGLFGTRVTDLVTQPDVVEVDFAGSADELAALYLSSFPPVVTTISALAETPERQAAFAHDLTEFFRGEYAAGGVRYDYLLVRATVA
jgi:SAM-dependent methyltransferase